MWFFCSLVANISLLFATFCVEKRAIFFFTFLQCVFLSLSSFFAGRYASSVLLLLCAIRNFLIARGKLDLFSCLILLLACAILSFLLDRSLAGFVSLVATVQITCFGFFCSDQWQRVGLFVNLFLWAVYGALVKDFPTMIVNGILCAFALVPVEKMRAFCYKRGKVWYNKGKE